ncbi:MAG: hypothetical protein MK193_00155 [Lentisphaeria bacterium]|nr:hypothetical protein [Lentisphaeria bacterium]
MANEDIELNIDTVGSVAGEICVELLRQSSQMEYVDSEGNPDTPSLENIALTAHRLSIICCTGIVPAAE